MSVSPVIAKKIMCLVKDVEILDNSSPTNRKKLAKEHWSKVNEQFIPVL